MVAFYRCQDPHKTEAWRVQNSPYYKLYRDTYWKCVTWGSNNSSVPQTPSEMTSDQTGTSSSQTETFSKSFKYTKSRSFPCTIAPKTCNSVWVLVNKYTLKRINGSAEEVVSTYEVNDGSNIRYSQFPKPKNFTPEDSVYKFPEVDPS